MIVNWISLNGQMVNIKREEFPTKLAALRAINGANTSWVIRLPLSPRTWNVALKR